MFKKRPQPKQHVDPLVSLMNPVGSLTYTHGELPPVVPLDELTTPREKKGFSPRKLAKRALIVLLVVLLAGGGWIGWKVYSNFARITGDKNPFHLFSSVPLKNTDGKINILLAGYSVDDPGHSGAALTDSIMVVSIDQKTNKSVIVSIPRDLWVKIPGNGYQKINAAYPYGEQDTFSEDGLPNGGMGLLEKIVSTNLNIPIHYYALINYTAFKEAVDAVGGITVDLRSEDNPYGLYDPYASLKLPNDIVKLDGQTALNLARARGDGPGAYGFPRSDFNRTEHQRMMLIALKEKATSSGVITNPLKIGQLADAAGNNVKTDMKTNEAESLFVLLKKINTNDIASVGLNDVGGKNLLKSYAAPGGVSALAPAAGLDNYSAIQAAIDTYLNPPPPQPASNTDSQN